MWSAAEQEECLRELRSLAASADFVVASGSLPPNVSPDFYNRVARVGALGTQLILDTSAAVCATSPATGFSFSSPVSVSSANVSSRDLPDETQRVAAARELIERGCARNILVSLGAQGALLVDAEGAQCYPPVAVQSGSGVGAGDAMIAGLTVGLSGGWSLTKSIRLGIAAGAADADDPGDLRTCTRADVERLLTSLLNRLPWRPVPPTSDPPTKPVRGWTRQGRSSPPGGGSSPFIVVPADDLHQVTGDLGESGVEDA
ncbi:Ribokinase [Mycolicibacterium aubagnense]